MSLLDEIYATPNRVQGVVRLLLAAPGHQLARKEAERLLSPDSLAEVGDKPKGGWRLMVRGAIAECVGLDLVNERDGVLILAPDVAEAIPEGTARGVYLPGIIASRIFAEDHTRNSVLALTIAWHLGQVVLSAPGTWAEFQKSLLGSPARGLLALNDNRHQMLRYWAPYLGFARVLPTFGEDKDRISPDPTRAIQCLLPSILSPKSGKGVAIHAVLKELAARCPVLDGGRYRTQVQAHLPGLQPHYVSTTTSHAFLSLQERGVLVLRLKSDAPSMIVSDGQTTTQVSEIAWAGKRSDA